MTDNPFVASLDKMRDTISAIAGNVEVVKRVDSLPSDSDQRINAVRALSPDDFLGNVSERESLRVSARWFEGTASTHDLRFTAGLEKGRGLSSMVTKKGLTVCVSIGVVISVSVGG